ncbi:hypothetical protein MAR_013215 [Mya arenaria]|uniref:Uncharacterized protein n=1 Tax=Mya arenaria TaxID=6604 RepID=A0ABY7G379_MYAAR|nr:hypothetical protein MAR_013215 [Mya arenaria]
MEKGSGKTLFSTQDIREYGPKCPITGKGNVTERIDSLKFAKARRRLFDQANYFFSGIWNGCRLKTCQTCNTCRPTDNYEKKSSAYVQEIGRSGRAGTSAKAILYYNNNNDLAVQHMRKEMKNYCKGDTCHRELINEYFGLKTINKPTECCSKCQPELGLEWDFDNLSI